MPSAIDGRMGLGPIRRRGYAPTGFRDRATVEDGRRVREAGIVKDGSFRQVQGTQRATTWASKGPEPGQGSEPDDPPSATRRKGLLAISGEHLLELAVIIVLALATIGTAWSGYQATRWSGVQAADYVTANFLRVESTKVASRAGQDRLYDSQVFSQWLNAYAAGNHDLASIYQRRFRPEFVVAFEAWMATESTRRAVGAAGSDVHERVPVAAARGERATRG